MTTETVTTKTEGEKWLKIGAFGWFVKYDFSDYWLNFRVWECVGEGEGGTPKLWRDDTDVPTEDFSKAERTFEGYVKWDGCMEVRGLDVYVCGREQAIELGLVLRELHQLCLLIPKVDKKCAGYARAPDPPPLPAEIDVDGTYLPEVGVTCIGVARRQPDGKYWCLANVNGQLCRIEVNITTSKV